MGVLLPSLLQSTKSVAQALMCLWVLWINHMCVGVLVCVCVCLGEQEECALAAPPQPPHAWPPAPGLESMRITRVTMEIHKHKYALGQQRTHTHTHAPDSLTANRL